MSIALDLFLKFLGPIIGVVVGVLMNLLVPAPNYALKYVVLLLGIILGTVLVDSWKLSKERIQLQKSLDGLSSALSYNLETDFERCELFQSPQQKLTPDQLPSVWLNLLMRFKDRFSATNFIPAEMMFKEKKYAELGLAAQAIQAKSAKTVQKILIFKEGELQTYRAELEAQHKAGLRPRIILYDKICRDATLAKKLNKLESIDFGLFDSKIVLLWMLNRTTRQVTSGRICFDRQQFEMYDDFFKALFRQADEFTPDN